MIENETKKFKLYIDFDENKKFKKQFDKISDVVNFLKTTYNIKDITKKKEDTYMFYVKSLIMQNWNILNCRKLIIKKFTYEKIYIVSDNENNGIIPRSLDFIIEKNEKLKEKVKGKHKNVK